MTKRGKGREMERKFVTLEEIKSGFQIFERMFGDKKPADL